MSAMSLKKKKKSKNRSTFLELKCIIKGKVTPPNKPEKKSLDYFEGFVRLHGGKNDVEEDGHSQEEQKLDPQRD